GGKPQVGVAAAAAAVGRAEPVAGQAAALRREPAPGYARPAIDDRHEEPAADDEDLRMEIPAFLRRQAN
ncbi:MAG: cell division protein FtsZ, partial [Pikeienuella sp.]